MLKVNGQTDGPTDRQTDGKQVIRKSSIKVECPSDEGDIFCRKYSHSVSDNSQL